MKQGFTLLELVICIAVIMVIAGLLAPTAKQMIDESKANRITTMCDAIKNAGQRFLHDTDRLPLEDSGGPTHPYSGPGSQQYHELSMTPLVKIPGWQGPYIDHALDCVDNPFKDRIRVFENMMGARSECTVMFWSVTQEVALLVDAKIDPTDANWMALGRVSYNAAAKTLKITLF